jgi:hypothetical protein
MARKLVTLLVIASFATLVFAFAGCGGDDESASGDTTVTETTTIEETEDTDTETTDTETTETEDTETSDDPDVATSETCREYAQIGAEVSTALTGARGQDIDNIKAAFDEYAAAAPEEIKDDFEAIADYLGEVADALEGVDFSSGQPPSPEVLAKLQSIDGTAATAAGTNITEWVTENCTGTTP